MKRDSIFYRIFKQNPALLFELVEESPSGAENYKFYSTNVKETEFRIDGRRSVSDSAGYSFHLRMRLPR